MAVLRGFAAKYVTGLKLSTACLAALLFVFLYTNGGGGWPLRTAVSGDVSGSSQAAETGITHRFPKLTLNRTVGAIFSRSISQDMIQSFQAELPEVLSDFQNPCWYEEIPADVNYNTSYFYTEDCQSRKQVTRDFDALQRDLDAMPRGETRYRLRCYPSVYLLGYTKSGTSSLYTLMKKHIEGLVAGARKESQYWVRRRFGIVWALCDNDTYYGEKAEFSDFLDLYDSAAKVIKGNVELRHGEEYHPWITGEFTPANSWFYPEWRRVLGNEGLSEPRFTLAHHLHGVWPKTKFIAILRNPVTRAKSHYLHLHGHNSKGFASRINTEMSLYQECLAAHGSARKCAYDLSEQSQLVTVGMYYIYLKDWLEVFPREQIYIIRTDDFAEDPASVIQGLADFLGLKLKDGAREKLDKGAQEERETKAAAQISEDEFPAESRMLREFYEPWNRKLAKLLGDKKWTLWDSMEESQTV